MGFLSRLLGGRKKQIKAVYSFFYSDMSFDKSQREMLEEVSIQQLVKTNSKFAALFGQVQDEKIIVYHGFGVGSPDLAQTSFSEWLVSHGLHPPFKQIYNWVANSTLPGGQKIFAHLMVYFVFA